MKLVQFEKKINKIYQPEKFKDYGPMGLVIEGKPEIKRGATAVSFSLEVVRQAVECKADFLVVHHPHDFWNNQDRKIVGNKADKVGLMMKNGISLFAYHLSMDMHPKLGNNIGILRALGIRLKKTFLISGESYGGMMGDLRSPITFKQFEILVEAKIGAINFSFNFGREKIKKVAVCSGGAAGVVRQAFSEGADVFVTGEAKEDSFTSSQDEKFNFIAAGHHRTEIFGPRNLSEYLTSNFKIPTNFINLANPV